jgi:hypothetical protein
MTRWVSGIVMLAAAIFEVGGDAMIRAGLRARGWVLAFGHFAFREEVATSTWIGLAVVLLRGAIIQFGGP